MKKLAALKLSLYCLWIRLRHKNKLVSVVFEGPHPSLGEILTNPDGFQALVVSTPRQGLNGWEAYLYVISKPVRRPSPLDLKLDFISDTLPPNMPVIMGNSMWIKNPEGDFTLVDSNETYIA